MTPKLNTKELTHELQSTLPDTQLHSVVSEVGEIVYVGDGICKVRGLPSARMEDVVTITTSVGEVNALVLGVSPDIIEAVVLGDYTRIKQGDIVRAGEGILRVPSGEGVFGRVLDPLGNPIDGRGPVRSHSMRPVELLAPGVAKRQPVTVQFQSGVLVVDTIIPLGRGQRELIIGDRKAGKTRLMASFIINQKGRDIPCIYVAIGAQKAKVRALEELLQANGAMDYTCIIMGGSDDPPSLNYLAPYSGTAVAEQFMYNGKDAIVIYDDLSKHAKAYRQMSLLLKRSPGRDAYPGDIFYLHSRLLERSARVSPDLGGGSLTGFPMAETQNGDVSEYICTNLMSITDGHIYLDVKLMHEGILPAVDSGTSVSRIGGGVQPPILRRMGEQAGTIMARYNEVKSFETINTEISEDTEREIKRGKRILEVFAQDSSLNLDNDEKILLLFMVTSGRTDKIELVDVHNLKTDLITFYRASQFTEYKEKVLKEKDIKTVEPLIQAILEAFAASNGTEAAAILAGKVVAPTPPVLPIVPDPSSPPAPEAKQKEG